MTQTQTHDDGQTYTLTRRQALKGLAVAGGATTAGVGSMQHPQLAPVGQSEAIAPVVAAAGATLVAGAAGTATGWLVREFEILGENPPADGLTADALQKEVFQTVKTRISTNASSIVDNRNIIDGAEHTAYADGKVAAIDALNAGETQSNVETGATDAADQYETTVKKNFLQTWNESVNEFETLYNALSSHADVSDPFNVLADPYTGLDSNRHSSMTFSTVSHTLPDGSTIDVAEITFTADNNDNYSFTGSPLGVSENTGTDDPFPHYGFGAESADGELIGPYIDSGEWVNIFDQITAVFDSARDGLILWVDNVYGSVQSGEIDTSELLTPRELAAMSAEEENVNQAIADLMALNIPVDLEREAEVYLPNVGATLHGQLAYTGSGTLSTGTIDPSADAESYYLTYDISQGVGSWDAYNSGVDGGIVTFTQEPYPSTRYAVNTTAGETAYADTADFTDQGDGTWTVDLSADLETNITNVEEVKFYSQTDTTQYETIQLQDTFEIVSFSDDAGEEYTEASFEQSEPMDDTNYITKEEWAELQAQNEELIQAYEESQESSGVGGGGLFDGGLFGGLFDSARNALVAIVAAVAGLHLLNASD